MTKCLSRQGTPKNDRQDVSLVIVIVFYRKLISEKDRAINALYEVKMVKHVILWKFKEVEDLYAKKILIKEGLEGLSGKISGMKEIKVSIDELETSNCDAMLEVVFDDFESLKGYAVNPQHVEVAETRIRPYIDTRLAFDFEI